MRRRPAGPPRLAAWLLQVSLPAGPVADTVLGDLHEMYERMAGDDRVGPGRAARWYWGHAVRIGVGYVGRRLRRESVPSLGVEGSPGTGMGGRTMKELSMKDLWNDIRLALRGLRRNAGFTLAATVILGLGIGANTTVFTLVSTLFLEPPPLIVEPDRLVRINRTTDGTGFGALAYPDYLYYEENNELFDGILAYDPSGLALTLGFGDGNAPGRGWLVSHNYFDVLGVRPAAGRWFLEEEDRTPGTHSVTVISHSLWQSAFGGSPDAVGATVTLNGNPFTIVGVAPEGFRGASPAEAPPDLWTPIHTQPILAPVGGDFPLRRVQGNVWVWLYGMGRLEDGATVEAAQTHMDGLASYLEATFPEWNEGWGIALSPSYRFHPPDGTSLATVTRLLIAVVGLVLIIACANVAVLLLARGSARSRDVAVRAALGAGRSRILRELLTESLLLALFGSALGLAVTYWSADAVAALLPLGFTVTFEPDWRVMAFATLLAGTTAVVFGLVPAWQVARVDCHTVLKGSENTPRSLRGRNLLVIAQVALALMVVTAAGLFARSLATARGIDLGFETEDRMLLSVNLTNHGYTEDEGRAFIADALDRVRNVPGVRSAATTRLVPFQGRWSTGVHPPGSDANEGAQRDLGLNAVSPGYFETMGIRLLSGRGFTSQDVVGQGFNAAVINRSTADAFWPGQDPLGRTFGAEEDREGWTVVGVAEDVHLYGLEEETPLFAYLPVLDRYASGVVFIVDTGGDPGVPGGVREAIHGIDPTLAFTRSSSLTQVVDGVLARYRVTATTVGLFGLLALALASVGLYGVLSYAVTRRSREIGIRVALGASGGQVGRSVLRQGMALAAVGSAVGLVGSVAGTRLLSGFLYGVGPRDPLTMAAVPLVLLAVAASASLLPAWRATRVHPTEVLKSE